MRFVHSLVKVTKGGKTGWCAPVELGEESPQYVSFVLPVNRMLDEQYSCDAVKLRRGEQVRVTYAMSMRSRDSFLLSIEAAELWFLRPVSKRDRRLPYVGKLEHPDFQFPLTEIEPESPSLLDQLFEENSISIIGCDPFTRYSGLEKLGIVSGREEEE